MAHLGQLVLILAFDHNLLVSIGRPTEQHNVQLVMLLGIARIGSLGAAADPGRRLAIFNGSIVFIKLNLKNIIFILKLTILTSDWGLFLRPLILLNLALVLINHLIQQLVLLLLVHLARGI